jgi:hypothetical protein
MPCFITDQFGIELIEGYRILIWTMPLRVGPRQILIGIGMAVNAPYGRMGKARVHGYVASKRLKNIQYLGEFKILFPAMGEPTPILPSRVFLEGNTHSIRMVYAYESLGDLTQSSTFGAKGFEPRQGESKASTTQKSSTAQGI